MDQPVIEIETLSSLAGIAAADWDACAAPETADRGRPHDPFTTHRFLSALEESGSVGAGTGWQPLHLVARSEGRTIAVMPLYAKSHSQGEYVFDHAWAQAYERAGGRYYPKLQAAVPFTPATGRRFLTRPGAEIEGRAALVEGATRLMERNGLSSFHVTFCTADEAEAMAGYGAGAGAGSSRGLLHRVTQQFHWSDAGFGDFDGFLNSLSSRKRKNIRRERQQAQDFGGEILSLTGDAIEPWHWDWFWKFYQDTGGRKWGTPYLTRRFFDMAHRTLRDDMLLVLAMRNGQPVAGALNFIGRQTLYGRYWGCLEDHPCLHFELCYYRAIDFALAHGLPRVEAGAQGEHKLARGYLPSACHSLHLLAERGFQDAVARYLAEERRAVDEEIEVLTAYGPFRRTTGQEDAP